MCWTFLPCLHRIGFIPIVLYTCTATLLGISVSSDTLMPRAHIFMVASVIILSVTSSCKFSSCHCRPRSPMRTHQILCNAASLIQVASCRMLAGRVPVGRALPAVGKSIQIRFTFLSFICVEMLCIDVVVMDRG